MRSCQLDVSVSAKIANIELGISHTTLLAEEYESAVKISIAS